MKTTMDGMLPLHPTPVLFWYDILYKRSWIPSSGCEFSCQTWCCTLFLVVSNDKILQRWSEKWTFERTAAANVDGSHCWRNPTEGVFVQRVQWWRCQKMMDTLTQHSLTVYCCVSVSIILDKLYRHHSNFCQLCPIALVERRSNSWKEDFNYT